jgi:DNA-directed RNA polymerase alpha subunit
MSQPDGEVDLPDNLGQPALRALRSAGITRIDQLTSWSQRELLALHGLGPKAIRTIVATLHDRGLGLRD